MHTLSNDMVRAIGWTLIHSLWQGLILAVVAGVLILFTRRAKPALRYNIFTGLFFVLVGSAIGTFFYELHQLQAAPAATAQSAAVNVPQALVTPVAIPEMHVPAAPGFTELFIGYFNEHAPLLVMCWFVVFAGKLLWLFSGLVSVQRIRYYKTAAPDVSLTNWLQMLAARLQLKRRVQLLESAMVKVPTAIGMLKPVILMPVGLMAQLPQDQVEAVLLHELAHIRRRDFLVNLIQHFAETIFFFNPALLWLSARIREEREHCCDDMAIAATQSKKGYIAALVSFQELHLATGTKYAMAFPGKKQQLLHRVKRILGQHNNTLNMAEKSFLLICFSLIGMLGMVFSHPGRQEAPLQLVAQAAQKITTAPDNKPQPASQPQSQVQQVPTVTAEDKHKDKFRDLDPNRVTDSTTVQFKEKRNGQPYQPYQPYEGNYKPYHPQQDTVPVLHKANATYTGTITNTENNGKVYKISVDNNRLTGLMIDGVQVPQDQLPSRYAEVNAIFRQMEGDAAEAELARHKQEMDRDTARRNSETQRRDAERQRSQLHGRLRTHAPLNAQSPLEPAAPIAPSAPLSPTHAPLPPMPPVKVNNDLTDKILADMMKDGLITQKDNLSFRLNENEFVVNDQPQSAKVLKRYKQKYVKYPSDTYTYSKYSGRTSSHIHVGN